MGNRVISFWAVVTLIVIWWAMTALACISGLSGSNDVSRTFSMTVAAVGVWLVGTPIKKIIDAAVRDATAYKTGVIRDMLRADDPK